MPSVGVSLSSTASKTVGLIPGSLAETTGRSKASFGYPTQTASLNLGSYTLFNFGKDRIAYEQARLDWERSQQIYVEQQRAVKFQVVIAYWTLKAAQNKLDASSRSVEVAEAILELQKSRALIGLATQSDVASAKVSYFSEKAIRDGFTTSAKTALWALNPLLGDAIGTEYDLEDELAFLGIKLTEDRVFSTYLETSPSLRTAKRDFRKAETALQLEQLDRLPLPKFTFSGVNVNYNQGVYGGRSDLYSQSSGDVNLDISASVALTLPLYGSGGFLKYRTIEAARIARDQSELRLRETALKERGTAFQLIQSIRQLEKTVQSNLSNQKNSSDVLKSVLASMGTDRVSRVDIKDAITQVRTSETELSDSLLSHLTSKIELAQLIGVDYLPRED
ncbi:TolC family protein [bacterium]|nr:TolC family protein [bacterium]